MSIRDRAGFTLIEALVATLIGTIVVGMVTSVMVSQSRYYGDASRRAELQTSVRAVVELVREELQSLTLDGIRTAETDQLVFRVPLAIGSVCDGGGRGRGRGAASVYLPAPGSGISSDRVSGWGWRDPRPDDTSGNNNLDDWNYRNNPWTSLNVGGGTSKTTCYNMGADTVGGGSDYYTLSGPLTAFADDGDLLMLYTEVEYLIDDSALRPGTLALFRREGTGSLTEFAPGLTSDTRFEYREHGDDYFETNPSSWEIDDIIEIRLTVVAERQDQIAGANSEYRWQVRIPIRNTEDECAWPCP